MSWTWTPVGVSGILAGLLAVAAACAIYALGAGRLQNKLLALFLLLLGAVSATGSGLMYLTTEERDSYAWQAVWVVVQGPFICAYLAFLSTLPSPLARPLTRVRPAFLALAFVPSIAFFVAPGSFIVGMFPGANTPWDAHLGTSAYALAMGSVLASVFGLIVAILGYRRTLPGTLARTQARAYLAAFAVLDLATVSIYTTLSLGGHALQSSWVSEGALIALRLSVGIFVILLCYGILKSQLFDFDLRLKWTIRRGTIALLFLGVFAIAFAIAEQYLQQFGVLIGGVAVGLLLLAFRPIERAADRLAARAMPHVEETPAYFAFRKMEVYKAAVEEVVADGSMSEKDRRVLDRLRTQLGLSAEDAGAMEDDVTGKRDEQVGVA